ncbi:molybdate ABC transporter substrate-binding protein [Hyphomicrobium sp. CS1BSMeth3]|uniref:molybdate ABC transporter substrate-binding protein n=1 Tax=Hyphomicrobium sp. CS1BSMeth3 TaxID=1892844 RepID=UPI0009314129|nr:molybdate ABC transporter substrate-binding protein [Hyphomicrobium sp. CS1BSMeth3]
MFGRSLATGLTGALTGLALALMPVQTMAAEIKMLGGSAMRALFTEMMPQFEKSSGHKVTIEYGTLGANMDRVMKGDAVDLVVVTSGQNERLQKESKLVAGSRAELAKVGYGVFYHASAAKPDLASVDGFKRTMLSAKSIALGDPAGGGPVGVYAAGLMQRLGLADGVKAKTKLYPSGTQVAQAVGKGENEVGIGLVSDVAVTPGLAAVPLPADIQNYTVYTLGIPASSKNGDAAKALIAFLTSTAFKQALSAKGFETP